MFLSNFLYSQLWAACSLSGLILEDGEIASSPKAARFYQQAGFSGPVHTFCGGPSQIDAGLMGFSQGNLIMAFRGTTSQGEDWANDFRSQLVPLKGCGHVHEGFLSSVYSLLKPMADQIPSFLSLHPSHFYLTGHSKGGAVAILMAHQLADLFPSLPSPAVITFGAPRPGDPAFAECYSIPLIRVESCRDLVVHLPMTAWECCGYASPGFLAPICPDKKIGPAHMAALPLNILSGAEERSFSRSSFRRLLNELADGGDLTRLADWHKKDYGF